MKSIPPRLKTLLAIGLLGSATQVAFAITNEEFSNQVRALRARMVAEPSVVGEAALLCAYLPDHRAIEEPKCIALRGHLRAEIARNRQAQASDRKSWLDQFAGCVDSLVEVPRG
ncbi:MAG: hypothetical protein ABI887_04615 [Burkholderiales bacterium]